MPMNAMDPLKAVTQRDADELQHALTRGWRPPTIVARNGAQPDFSLWTETVLGDWEEGLTLLDDYLPAITRRPEVLDMAVRNASVACFRLLWTRMGLKARAEPEDTDNLAALPLDVQASIRADQGLMGPVAGNVVAPALINDWARGLMTAMGELWTQEHEAKDITPLLVFLLEHGVSFDDFVYPGTYAAGDFRMSGHSLWSRAVHLRLWHLVRLLWPQQASTWMSWPRTTEVLVHLIDVLTGDYQPLGSAPVVGGAAAGGAPIPGWTPDLSLSRAVPSGPRTIRSEEMSEMVFARSERNNHVWDARMDAAAAARCRDSADAVHDEESALVHWARRFGAVWMQTPSRNAPDAAVLEAQALTEHKTAGATGSPPANGTSGAGAAGGSAWDPAAHDTGDANTNGSNTNGSNTEKTPLVWHILGTPKGDRIGPWMRLPALVSDRARRAVLWSVWENVLEHDPERRWLTDLALWPEDADVRALMKQAGADACAAFVRWWTVPVGAPDGEHENGLPTLSPHERWEAMGGELALEAPFFPEGFVPNALV